MLHNDELSKFLEVIHNFDTSPAPIIQTYAFKDLSLCVHTNCN